MIDQTLIEPVNPVVSKKFLHLLQCEESPPSFGSRYVICGVDWSGMDFVEHDYLDAHCFGDVILNVRCAYDGDGYRWDYSKRLADGVYARHGGTAGTIDAACHAALEYQPVTRVLSYLNTETIWYETEPGRLYAQIDGHEANVRLCVDGKWHSDRKWPPAKPVIDAIEDAFAISLNGVADSVEAAMIQCIDAPEKFKRACAAFVASLSGGQSQ